MVREVSPSSNSGEERHDRFRSERCQTSSKTLAELTGKIPSGRDGPTKATRTRSSSRSPRDDKYVRHRKKKQRRSDERRSSSPHSYSSQEHSAHLDRYEFEYSSYYYREKYRYRSRSREFSAREEVKTEGGNFPKKHKKDKHKSHKKKHKDKSKKKKSEDNSVEKDNVIQEHTSCDVDHKSVDILSSREDKLSKIEEIIQKVKQKTSLGDTDLLIGKENECEDAFGEETEQNIEKEASHDESDVLEDENVLGPALPPGMAKDPNVCVETSSSEILRPFIGPILPGEERVNEDCCDKELEEDSAGQLMEVHEKHAPSEDLSADDAHSMTNLYGPMLPPKLREQFDNPPILEEEEADFSVGPLPAGMTNSVTEVLDARASLLKKQLDSKGDDAGIVKKRERWMLELPEDRAGVIGLGPRKFKKRESSGKSGSHLWTDTPAEKERKAQLSALGIDVGETDSREEELKKASIKERDEAMERMTSEGASSSSKKEKRSLLEIHQKQLRRKKRKEKKEKGEKEERRPFSRETDLQVNRFDNAQKKSVIKKAQLLNTRFAAGESKYL